MFLGSIVIIEQVKTLYFILRIEVCFSVRSLSPSKCKLTLYPKEISLLLSSIVIIE